MGNDSEFKVNSQIVIFKMGGGWSVYIFFIENSWSNTHPLNTQK